MSDKYSKYYKSVVMIVLEDFFDDNSDLKRKNSKDVLLDDFEEVPSSKNYKHLFRFPVSKERIENDKTLDKLGVLLDVYSSDYKIFALDDL